MLIANEIDNAVRLQTLETLITALDHCNDVVQITDHDDKIIFQNSAGERALGFSSDDYLGADRRLWDFQSTSAMYSHVVLEENEAVSSKVGLAMLSKHIYVIEIDNIKAIITICFPYNLQNYHHISGMRFNVQNI